MRFPSDFGFRISGSISRLVFGIYIAAAPAAFSQDAARQLSAALKWASDQVRPAFVTFSLANNNTKSGVLVDPDGYVLTSFRAVQGQTNITARAGGRAAQGKVVATDREGDLALIKLDGNNFPFAKLGDSGAAQVGDWVVTMGFTQGVSHNSMHGIVSSPARRVTSRDGAGTVPMLQVTCAVDNSSLGAPLVNVRGEVIGIVSQFPTARGGEWSEGLCHASPSNRARQLLEKTKGSAAATPAPSEPPCDALETARQLGEAIRELADQIKPAVVSIRAKQNTSGFVVDARGYILTAAGSLSNGEQVKIFIGADTQNVRDGKVLALDTANGLALVKSEGRFPALRLGDSDKTRIGEWVMVVGAPFGYVQSVTVGVLSFKARKGSLETPTLQISAALDTGGGGAPLLNADGEVIGVCLPPRGNAPFSGYRHAVPINVFKSRLQGQIPK